MHFIHVVRETGGLGDWVRIFPVLDGLRRKHPDTPIAVHGPRQYADLVMNGHCWGMDREGCIWVNTDGHRVRAHRGAKISDDYLSFCTGIGGVIDLNCPAWAHERATQGAPTLDRVELFCNRAGVEVMRPEIHFDETLVVNKDPDRWPGYWPWVGIHTASAAILRNWRNDNWRRLSEMLDGEGVRVLEFRRGALSWPMLLHYVSVMASIIAVDSGILHLAGALGVPVLGLFGCTRGDLVCKPYPRARWIQAQRPAWCKDRPCYGYNEQGFGRAECSRGCAALNKISPEAVFEVALEMLASRGDAEGAENGTERNDK